MTVFMFELFQHVLPHNYLSDEDGATSGHHKWIWQTGIVSQRGFRWKTASLCSTKFSLLALQLT